jgi:peptidoglycan/LPS O-acetylase OafA/YrhL
MHVIELEQIPPDTVVGANMLERRGRSGPNKRVIQLDFLRGVAILLVIGYHALTIPTSVVVFRLLEYPFKRLGWSGVDLFFVLSGFLVGGLLIRDYRTHGLIRVGRFFKRRAFKIWPAYYFYLLFQIVSGHFPLSTFLLPNLLHLQNYLGTSLAHTWTLAVEEHFYLLLPLVLIILTRSKSLRPHVLSVLVAGCIGVLMVRSLMVIVFNSTRVWEYTHTRLDSLLFGVILSYLYYYRRDTFDRIQERRLVLMSVSALGVAFLCVFSDASPVMRTIGYTLNYITYGSLMLLALNSRGTWTQSMPYRLVASIGVYSYSIYLWHVSVRTPVLNLTSGLRDDIRWPTLFILQFCCAIGLGLVMAKTIEWPFLKLREWIIPADATLVSATPHRERV